MVTDSFDNGGELLDTVDAWMGTQIPAETAERLATEDGPVRVHQDVRLRVLRAA